MTDISDKFAVAFFNSKLAPNGIDFELTLEPQDVNEIRKILRAHQTRMNYFHATIKEQEEQDKRREQHQ